MSRLGEERTENPNRDLPNLIPLPSSPINIPPPMPTLRLDFGPSGLDLESEIRALQDPRNITTGFPTSHPLGWGFESGIQEVNAASPPGETCIPESPDDAFALPPPPQLATGHLGDDHNENDTSADYNAFSVTPAPGDETAVARRRYSVALFSSRSMDLDFEISRHVVQNPFRGGPEVPQAEDNRSESDLTEATFSPPSLSVAESASDAAIEALQVTERDWRRNDSLFDDFALQEVPHQLPQHGPPSPTRSLQLPFRPKPVLTKHVSFESVVFKPFLDRIAARRLEVFRPGSDLTLGQRYFPHVTIGATTSYEYPRQTSLDSDSSNTSARNISSEDSGSSEDVGIFERVDRPPPLHIRKQSGTEVPLPHEVLLPQTPKDAASPHTPGSSPTRTPSMGDRQLFDLQSAERNARYNAIHSGNFGSDLHLADFGNAGPGSRGSTPKRDDGEKGGDVRGSPTRAECAVPALPVAAREHRIAKGMSWSLSRD